jgi:hypothetical protein
MIADDSITLATYAKEHDLLTTHGYKRLNPIATDLDKNKLRLRTMMLQYNVSKGLSINLVFKYRAMLRKHMTSKTKMATQNGLMP